MKVLVVCDVLGEENNGTTIAAMNLIRYLRSQGDEVRILCADQYRKNEKGTFVVPNIYLGLIANKILKKNNVTLAKPNRKIIEKALEGIDVVHIMIPFALGIKTLNIAKKKGIPVTAGFHCQAENFTSHIFNTMNSKALNNAVYKNFYKNFYSKVNAIHYPTEFIRNVFEDTVKRKTNGYVISNGVNDLYRKKEIKQRKPELQNKINILFIGRLSKEKSHPILLKAVALSKYKKNIQLIFAGQGPRRKEIDLLVKKYKIKKPIIKFFTRKELVNIINSSDLYVHPAEIEIEAISCLEAISCGLVPIISDSKRSATNSFALTENNLFKNNDPQDLANKIDYWIEHEKEKEECSKLYLGYTEKFNQNECMKRMRNMLLTYAQEINHTKSKIIYYRDELNDDFANNGIVTKKVGSNYKYEHKNIFYKTFEFILYFIIAKPVISLLNKIVYKQKIVNHTSLKKSEIKGCFVYSNHTLSMGDAYTPNLISNHKNNIIVNPDAVSVKGIRTIVAMLGGLPLPTTLTASINFLDAIKNKIHLDQLVTIYPEAHIWPYYTKIRNFSDGSFKYPIDLKVPVFCITNTFVPYKKSYRLVSHIDGPFMPNFEIDKKVARNNLRDLVFATMNKRANEVEQFEKIKYVNLNEIEIK